MSVDRGESQTRGGPSVERRPASRHARDGVDGLALAFRLAMRDLKHAQAFLSAPWTVLEFALGGQHSLQESCRVDAGASWRGPHNQHRSDAGSRQLGGQEKRSLSEANPIASADGVLQWSERVLE